ncbi:ParA family partition ATPase [Ovoidimarina sediminis]|uniref:ParA family partition ATPase n=1 Tax=Ovoidimarina sediminis TaxID=3079856 RepID=UPI0029123A28|nr:ParA family partition ATPase [Rhodophyticola sp. MJ-SS7]MDU8942985.1 ParA family partition ATPase [Rhodophyticola sp. MJ-SS7]
MGQVITVAQQKGGSGKTTLAANLAVALTRDGASVALLDTDPQGSLGRWFMARREAGIEDMEFSTASAWGVSYECEKLKKLHDFVLVDTPPKVDADLRPALRESDLVIVPVAASQVDVWATESVLDLARRERRTAMVVLNRAKAGTRVLADVTEAIAALDAIQAETVIGNRVAYAETLGHGRGVLERGKGAWTAEIRGLTDEVRAHLS